jgi:acetolactate synthase-1/2/3 large subunit
LPDYKKWNDEVLQYQKKYETNIIGSTNNSLLNPIRFLQEFLKKVNKNAILTLDVGQNQMWVSQVCQNQSQHRILSGVGYGSMGCSLPYAIGACYATQNKRQIICFTGDGGFQMNMQELMLISSMNLNIKIIIFNNEGLGLIREAQDKYMDSRYIGTDINYSKCPNLENLSKAYNLSYAKIWHLEDCNNIDNLINSNKPCIIEVVIDKKAELLNKYNDYKNLAII